MRMKLSECNEATGGFESWSGTLGGERVCCEVFNQNVEPGRQPDCEPFHSGSGGGDPHFKLWNGARIDFHGGCDLVLVRSANFSFGKGLDIHIRTTIESDYSFIEEVAVKIGRDTLQVAGDGVVFFNDVAMGADLKADLPAEVSGFPLSFSKDEYAAHFYNITIGGHDEHSSKIRVKTWNEMVWVDIDDAKSSILGDAVGLLGDFSTGKMMARNDETVIEDADSFGREWQVQGEEDGILFQINRTPQYPQVCDMPDPAEASRRRLGDTIPGLQKAANEVCARWGEGMEACVFDIMATGHIELAEIGSF